MTSLEIPRRVDANNATEDGPEGRLAASPFWLWLNEQLLGAPSPATYSARNNPRSGAAFDPFILLSGQVREVLAAERKGWGCHPSSYWTRTVRVCRTGTTQYDPGPRPSDPDSDEKAPAAER